MAETLENLIKKYEDQYEISITLKTRYRKIPILSVLREKTGDYEEDASKGFPCKYDLTYLWQAWEGHLPSKVAETVNDELVDLIQVSKMFGAVLKGD